MGDRLLMTREAAEAEAAKREKHKSPSVQKHWEAVHSSTRGWHVALVDDPLQASFVAHAKARNALLRGDPAFFDLAAEALLARCRASLASVGAHPEGGDPLGAPFMGDAVPKADAQTPAKSLNPGASS